MRNYAANDPRKSQGFRAFQTGITFHTGGVRCSIHLSPTKRFQALGSNSFQTGSGSFEPVTADCLALFAGCSSTDTMLGVSDTTTLFCIWPKCDEHCVSSSLRCSRHSKRVPKETSQPPLPAPFREDIDHDPRA